MVDLARVSVLSPNDVVSQVQAQGIGALGVAALALSPQWASTTPGSIDDATLRMTLAGILAPFTGTYAVLAAATAYSGPDGAPLMTAAGVLQLHPEAVHRLESSVRGLLGTTALDRPVPVAMLVHGVTVPGSPQVMQWFRAGEAMPDSGAVSFHDRRGLIIDPVAVAALCAALVTRWPGLIRSGVSPAIAATAATGAGGVSSIAGIAGPAVRAHVVDPHGAVWRGRRPGIGLSVLDTAGAVTGAVPASGLVDLAAGSRIGRAGSAGPTPPASDVLWGSAPGGELSNAAWAPPAVPGGVALPRQFFRIVAADLPWHLLGNRGWLDGEPTLPKDPTIEANAPLPVVRQTVASADYLLDGNDVLGAMGSFATTSPGGLSEEWLLACSPTLDTSLALPPATGTGGHWPAFPAPTVAPGPNDGAAVTAFSGTTTETIASGGTPTVTATWRVPAAGANRDVIVTIAAGALPVGTHVRVMPRTFVVIRAIGPDEPSFVRGDGCSALVGAGPTSVLLANPFGLGAADALPDDPHVHVDVVVVARDGTRRLLSELSVPVGPAATWTDNPAAFGGSASAPLTAQSALPGHTSIAPVSEFGIAAPPGVGAHPGAGGSVLDWVKWLTNEGTWPRVGPHLPSQARFETVLAHGTATTGNPTLAWNAVLSGARYDVESRCAAPHLGDPGNPAGPDVHVTGMRVGGQLAYDLAVHALKRCQSIVPTAPTTGWLPQTGGDNWDVPAADPAPAAGLPHLAGAMLETVAAICDSPELSLLPIPDDTASVQQVANDIANAIAPGSTLAVTIANEPRLVKQLQREIATARGGQRDALWSIARAVAEARDYVLIESPMLARTARPTGANPETGLVDLVTILAARLTANPRLKVLLCLPRLPDFDLAQQAWVRGAFRDRTEALQLLIAAGGERVQAFHPAGFPGRPTVGRSTTVLVDDAYALVGTSHWRRRGMSFDGGCDIVTTDRRLDDRGVGGSIARFRQEILATRLGIAMPSGASTTAQAATASALWTRLAEPESAWDTVRDLLKHGGQGRCSPVWAGPTDSSVLPETTDTIDPNGIDGPGLLALFTGLIP